VKGNRDGPFTAVVVDALDQELDDAGLLAGTQCFPYRVVAAEGRDLFLGDAFAFERLEAG
jgi:hypothetical protein